MKENTSLIFETEYFEVILVDDQIYLGRCVIQLKRKCGDLAKLTLEEQKDFFEVVNKLQNLCRKTFNATMFNWGCLMNHAYREASPDPQVHWHFRPRYDHSVEFEGEVFKDPNFGEHYVRSADVPDRIVSPELKAKIVAELQKNL